MEGQYFKKALASFVYDFASGDTIRKYAEQGMSINQIKERLSFPTPMDRIWETVWNHYLLTNRILLEEPGKDDMKRYKYVKELSSYGKVSYRKVELKESDDSSSQNTTHWSKKQWNRDDIIDFGVKYASQTLYVEVPFGQIRYKNQEQYQEILNCLSSNQKDFIDGLFQKKTVVYYRLDEQMKNILLTLDCYHLYEGKMYLCESSNLLKTV